MDMTVQKKRRETRNKKNKIPQETDHNIRKKEEMQIKYIKRKQKQTKGPKNWRKRENDKKGNIGNIREIQKQV